jgi:hypothetical protein
MPRERRKGGRRRSDHEAKDVTLTNDRASGTIEHDDRGDARWVFASEQQAKESAERTFNELKALDNEALEILEQPDRSRSNPPPGGGYNPYDAVVPPKKPAAKKNR